MLRDGTLVCDRCGKTITRVVGAPATEWSRMHNLCADCFREVRKESIPPA